MLTKVLEQLVPLAPEEGHPRSSVVQMFAPKLLLTAFDRSFWVAFVLPYSFSPFLFFHHKPYRPPRPFLRPLPSSPFFSSNCPLPYASPFDRFRPRSTPRRLSVIVTAMT